MVKRFLIMFMTVCLLTALTVGCTKDKTESNSSGIKEGVNADDNVDQQKDTVTSESSDIQYIDYVIYLKHIKLPFIYGERFDIASNDPVLKDKSIEQIALEHLINYQQVENFITPIPKDTKLLEIEKKDNKIYINLSKEFIDNMKKDETDTKIAIASIVNTLTFFPNNEEVFIKIEGKIIEKLNGVVMNKEFKFSSEFVPDK